MKNIDKFLIAIENDQFIQAHEILEEDWKYFKKVEQKDKARAIKGLINGATALALLVNKKKPEAYVKIWKVFEKYRNLLNTVDLEDINKFKEAKRILEKKNYEFKKLLC